MQTWSQGILPVFLAFSGFGVTHLLLPGSVDNTGLTIPLFVAAAMLGWSSVILYSRFSQLKVNKVYIILSIFMTLYCSEFHSESPDMIFWQRVIAFMVITGIAGLRQFVIKTDIRKTGDESFRQI